MERISEVRVGASVEMTDEGVGQHLLGRAKSRRGEVLAVDPPFRVKVLRDGLKTPEWYHCKFWNRTAR